jgi:phosphoglycolate phosphatase-like HAD superfamily hydrolase
MTTGPDWSALVRPGAVWAFDVDGTLIGSIRSDVLRPGAADLLHTLGAHGVACVLWSAGGAEYAARTARRHGLDRAVVSCYGKDSRDGMARYRTDHLAPEHVPDVFVDDVPGDLPAGAMVLGVPQFLGGNSADTALVELLGAVRAGIGRVSA